MNITGRVICPYCGHENVSVISGKPESRPIIIYCDDSGTGNIGCGRYFAYTYTTQTIVTYETFKIEKVNK